MSDDKLSGGAAFPHDHISPGGECELVGGHDPSNPKANNDNSKHMTRLCNQCVIEKALSAYRKAVQP